MYRIAVIFLLMLSAGLLSAQEYGLFQMRDVWNASHLNPGFFPRQEFIVSLPSVHTSLNAIGVNRERLFEFNSAENTNYLNLDGVVGKLERDLILKNSTIIDGLGIGGRLGNFFISLSTSSVLDAEVTLPQALLRTVWEGTEDYLDQPLNIGPAGDMIAYQKVGLGLNYAVNPRLAIGLRINRLLGGASFVTNRNQLTLTQSSDIYQTTAALDYQAFYYGAGQVPLLDANIKGFENFGDALDQQGTEPEGGSGLRQYTNGNNGWSVDLGAEYLMGDRLTLSASLLNLGSIRWKNATQQVNLTGTVNFEGVDAANLDEDDDFEVIPGIDTVGTFEAVSNVAYTQALSPRTYLGANYQVLPFLDVGGLLYNEFFGRGTFTALSLSSRVSLGRILSLGGVYTFQNGTFNSFGANAALKLGPVQIYAIADNLSSLMNEERLDGANVRAGLNLTFGRKKSDLKLAAARSMDTEMPGSGDWPADPVVTEAQTAEEPENRYAQAPALEKEESVVENESRLSEDFNTTKPVPSQSAETEKAEDVRRDEPPAEQQLLTPVPPSEEEAEAYPENHPVNASALKLFPFKLELRDAKDLGLVEEATVNVYRIEEGGYFKLIQTKEAFGGRVNMQLAAEKVPYQAVVQSSGYEKLVVDFQPARNSSFNEVAFLTAAEPASEKPIDTAAEAQTEQGAGQEPAVPYNAPADTLVPETAAKPPVQTEQEIPAAPEPEPEPVPEVTPEPNVPEESAVGEAVEEDVPAATEPAKLVTYLLTQKTSLREEPNSRSRVISRMPVDTELKLLEKTNEWWWKVSMGGWEGYVKAALLKLRD